MRVTWVQPEDLVRHELWQSAREGRDVHAQRDRWLSAGGASEPPYVGASPEVASPALRDLAEVLLAELDALPEGSIDAEPSDWDTILGALSRLPRAPTVAPTGSEAGHDLADRLRGAWLGRAIGCVLGKPVEKVPRAGIEAILRSTGRWPLDRWFTAVGLDPAVSERWPWNKASRSTSLEENLAGMPEDDDLNYTIMALRVLEQHGPGFTSADVAQMWLLDLPAGRTFTAERVAYRNLLEGVSPPETARVRNPFREWIGAQIRTDLYGWVNPGNPLRAAEWAWRDASVSHTRNGLYGAMFVAAMASEAVHADDIDQVLDVGSSVVPPASRLFDAIALGRELGRQHADPTQAYASLEAEFAGMHWVHSLNNTALVAFALQAGQGDFDRSICLTVMGGWDTDSNGATVGAVTGALRGAKTIDSRWANPLGAGLMTSIPDPGDLRFDALVQRTRALAEQVREL